MTALRIGIDWRPALLPQPAGVGRVVTALVEALPQALATRPRAHEVVLYADRTSPPPTGLREVRRPPDLRLLRGTPAALAWHAWSLVDLERRGIDLWLATNSLVVPFARPGRAVPIIHDLSAFHHGWTHRWKVRAIHHVAFRRALTGAPRVITISEATRRELLARVPLDPERVVVVPLGIAPIFLVPGDPVANGARRRALGLPERYLLAVGTLEPRKNLPGLLRALAILVRRRPDCPPLVLVGQPGWGNEDLARIAADLGIAEHVKHLDFVSDADLVAVYDGAALLALPSFHEGFGLPLVEAMARGVPIVSSTAGSLPEVAGDAASYADPHSPSTIADALEQVLIDPAGAARRVEAGRRRATGYTWPAFARRVIEVLEDAAADQLPPAAMLRSALPATEASVSSGSPSASRTV